MVRIGQDAIDYARSRVGGTMPAAGYCLQFTRECFAVAAYYGSAVDAAYGCNAPHPGDRNPPPGVPVWFRTPSVYDHVCFFVGPNEVISTFNEDIRSFNGIEGIEANFSGTYAGWGEDLNEVTVYYPDTLPVPGEESEDQMFVMLQETRGIALVGSNYYHGFTGEEWATYNQQVVARGIVPLLTLDANEAGKAQFDLIRAAHTRPS